jgi:outer membrane protein
MKKFIILLLVLLPMGAFSQEMKIAFVNFQDVFELLPDYGEALTKFETTQAQYAETAKSMETEYQAKYEEYMRIQDTMAENLKLRKQQEIQDIGERYQTFMQQSQQDLEQEYSKLMAPVQEKVLNAIKAVGEEQGYAILNAQVFFHTGPAIDATPLVKTKLGIR